jgi:outer membrane murein-binding lipoprotein Lpp
VAAINHLEAAKRELEAAPAIFRGHREAAIKHVNAAIEECNRALEAGR